MDEPTPDPAQPGTWTDAEFLAAYLRGRDLRCPACGYNLRGVANGRCPECNQRVSLAIAESTMHRAYWYAALSAFAWPLLLNGMICAVWVMWVGGMLGSGSRLDDVISPSKRSIAIAVPTMTVVSLAGLVVLVWTRRRPWRPRTRRVILGVLVLVFLLHAFWLLPLGIVPAFYP